MEFINYIKSINGNIFSLITTFIGILGGWYIGWISGRISERTQVWDTIIVEFDNCLNDLNNKYLNITDVLKSGNYGDLLNNENLKPDIDTKKYWICISQKLWRDIFLFFMIQITFHISYTL